MKRKKQFSINRRKRVPKSFLYAVTGTLVLTVLFLGAGVAYTYYNNSEDDGSSEQVASDTTNGQTYKEPSVEPSEPAPDADVGVSAQVLTSPVEPGSNATFGVRTLRGAECDIEVEYDEVESQDTGLTTKTADRFGMVSWTWTVEETAPEGEWPIEVVCERNEKSGFIRKDIHVTYDTDGEE